MALVRPLSYHIPNRRRDIKPHAEIDPEIFRFAMKSIRDYAVFLMDPDGYVATWNLGAELIKQWKAEEIIGKHYSMLFTPEDQARGKPEIELSKAKEKGLFEEENTRMKKDGTLFEAHVSLTALRNEKDELIGFVKVTRDITDRLEAEKNLLRSQEELRTALTARDEFLSIASHELKTPLTSLKLQCELFVHKFKKGQSLATDSYEKFARQTSSVVNKLTRLVDDMLDISRIQFSRLSLSKEQVNICDCVKDSLEALKPVFNLSETALPTLEYCQEMFGDLDKLRIEQVFNNLLTNAIRYGDGKPITVRAELADGVARVTIQDQGAGIPADKIDKIFDRFERARQDRAIQGLGLGLYITKQIVEAHGGRIWVESEVGKGSTFYVELPCMTQVYPNTPDRTDQNLRDLH